VGGGVREPLHARSARVDDVVERFGRRVGAGGASARSGGEEAWRWRVAAKWGSRRRWC